jgi:hypothetical protein
VAQTYAKVEELYEKEDGCTFVAIPSGQLVIGPDQKLVAQLSYNDDPDTGYEYASISGYTLPSNSCRFVSGQMPKSRLDWCRAYESRGDIAAAIIPRWEGRN